jgi:signal transduction histidine kinase/PAS domain-containing protein
METLPKLTKSEIELLTELGTNDFMKYAELPLAVYVTSRDGEFILANNSTLDLFDVKSKIELGNVLNYYAETNERDRVISRLTSNKNGEWVKNQNLVFEVTGERKKVRFCCKVIKPDGEFLGVLCLVTPNDGFELSNSLAESLPIATFEMVSGNRISYANSKFLEFFKIDKKSLSDFDIIRALEIPQVDADNYYELQREKYKQIIKELLIKKRITNMLIELQIGNDDFRVAQITLEVEEEFNDKIHKVKGLINDISVNQEYEDVHERGFGRMILDQRGSQLTIRKINKNFKKLFDIDVDENCVNWDVSKVITDLRSITELKNCITNFSSQDSKIVSIKKIISGVTVIALNMHVIRLASGTNRYYCAIYANVDEIENHIRSVSNNFSSFLHSYAAMATNIKDTLASIIDGHGTQAVNNGTLDQLHVLEKIKGGISSFNTAYKELQSEIKALGLTPIDHNQIDLGISTAQEDISLINYSNFSIPAESIRPQFIYIRETLLNYNSLHKVSPKLVIRLQAEIGEVLRYCRLVSLVTLKGDAMDMISVTDGFKDIIKLKESVTAFVDHDFLTSIDHAISNLKQYAAVRRQRIVIQYDRSEKAIVHGDRLGLYTVFYNVLHNAIKYSFTKANRDFSKIFITVKSNDITHEVSFTNTGVGIPSNELESGILFELRSRGISSTDRMREGQGIGLWHCMNILKQCGGIIIPSSVPKFESNMPSVPHLTTFTIIFKNALNKHG